MVSIAVAGRLVKCRHEGGSLVLGEGYVRQLGTTVQVPVLVFTVQGIPHGP